MTSSRRPHRTSAAPPLAPVPAPTRGGEDVRRRGWFWHWNALVTQYAPLIGLKGVGLLNSYTVWTDRREESPHRGYAFPSQVSEANFYGEDRAELITINKILVALDLIEIRKEMVLRVDAQGRRWKAPHNFYRVKDHGDDFTLGAADVLRVAELAAKDRAVYRYVRRVFSPRFAPIDGDNVWVRILLEVRAAPVWQQLAAKAAAEEERASARTRAGHAARKGSNPTPGARSETGSAPPFFVPSGGDDATTAASGNDSSGVAIERGTETSVASVNTGLAVDVGGTNRGSPRKRPSTVAPANAGDPTVVGPTNTTYHQSSTTTKESTDGRFDEHDARSAASGDTALHTAVIRERGISGPARRPPADGPGEAAALRAFEGANDRAATPAERTILRDLAARFQPVADAARVERDDVPDSGWGWLEAAVWEAVEAGSAFVAPRRLREILLRWERDGFPRPRDPEPAMTRSTGRPPGRARHAAEALQAPRPLSPVFVIQEVGLSNRQVWAAALAELAGEADVSRADLETWLRPASLIGREGDTLIVGAPNAVARDRIANRLLAPLRRALAATMGVALNVVVETADETMTRTDGAAAS